MDPIPTIFHLDRDGYALRKVRETLTPLLFQGRVVERFPGTPYAYQYSDKSWYVQRILEPQSVDYRKTDTDVLAIGFGEQQQLLGGEGEHPRVFVYTIPDDWQPVAHPDTETGEWYGMERTECPVEGISPDDVPVCANADFVRFTLYDGALVPWAKHVSQRTKWQHPEPRTLRPLKGPRTRDAVVTLLRTENMYGLGWYVDRNQAMIDRTHFPPGTFE